MLKGPTEATLAITSATGAVGGRIASRLAALGQGQRLVVRDAGRAPDLPNAEVAEAAYADTRALRQALAGARTFFMVSAGEIADRARRHAAAVDAVVAAGVERIVYLSFLNAPDATFTFAGEPLAHGGARAIHRSSSHLPARRSLPRLRPRPSGCRGRDPRTCGRRAGGGCGARRHSRGGRGGPWGE